MIDCQNAIGRSAGSFSSIVPLGCRFLQRKSLREGNDDCIRRRLWICCGFSMSFISHPLKLHVCRFIRDAEQNWFIIRELYTIYHFNIRLFLSHLLFDSRQMNKKINFRILYEFHRQPELTGETPWGGSCGPWAGRRMEIEKSGHFSRCCWHCWGDE